MPDVLLVLYSPFFIRALIAAILISFITATMGSFTVFRGLTFIASTIAHAVWAGAALGLLIQLYFVPWLNPIIVTIAVGVVAAITISLLAGDGEREKFDVAIGIIFATSMSLVILFISMLREYASRTFGLLLGDILLLSWEDLMYLLALTALVVFLTLLFLNQFIFISFDYEGARVSGIKAEYFQILMFTLIALSIVVMVKSIGAILVYAILTIPPAIANEVSKTVYQAMLIAFITALVTSIAGLFLSIYVGVAPSALMGLMETGLYVIVKLLKR